MNSFVVYEGSDGQILSDQIKKDGKPYSLEDADVELYMRHADSSTLKIDGASASIDNEAQGLVSYPWTDVNLNDPGEYFAWWKVVNNSGSDLDTDEFLVIVTKHSPGYRTETGAIYRKARAKIPTTWTALENKSDYGDALLQEQIEVCKLSVFGASVAVADEVDYDIRVIDYIAKLAVIYVIPAGIDYWLDQHQSIQTAGGPSVEVATFPDRIEALKAIREEYIADVAKDKAIIEDILDVPQILPSHATPEYSDGGDCEEGFVTPNPTYHYRDYAFPGPRSGRHNWTGFPF